MTAPAFDMPLRPVREDTQVHVYVHGLGLLKIRPLHDLDAEIHDRLLAGDIIPALETLPQKILDAIKGEEAHEIVRFVTAWIHAGYDYELAAWAGWLAMVRVYPAFADESGEESPRDSLAIASNIADDVEEIGTAIAANWLPVH